MKVIIFGTGKLYEASKYKFKNLDIVAFVDNNPDKQGTYIDGIKVISPSLIQEYHYKYILIVSQYYREMRSQLENMGIPKECILDREYRGAFSGIRNIEMYKRKSFQISKPQILLVSHDLSFTGAPIVLYNMASILLECGYSVTVYSGKMGGLLYDFIEKGISVTVFEDFNFDREEIQFYFSKFDLIIANTVTLYRLVTDLKCLQIPIVWWIHEEDNIYEELNIKHSDLVISDYVFPYGVSDRAIWSFCNYSGRQIIDKLAYGISDKSNFCNTSKKVNKKAIFAIIGTVDRRKAQDVFVEAVRENWEKWEKNAEFWIIGSISEKLRKQYEKLKALKILGEMDHEELMGIYPEIDIVVCPSRNDPLPVVLAEGMMNKKVCIASDMTGTAEYIKPYENGLLCKAGNVESLADSIQWVIDHRENWKDIGEKAYLVYKNVFSIDQFKKNVIQIVETYLKRS